MLIEQDEDGIYIVSCPSLKGCHSYGATIDEAVQNISEAIELCLEDSDIDSYRQYRAKTMVNMIE